MEDFVEFVRDDGTIEMRHPNYDELVEKSMNKIPNPPIEMSEEELALGNLNAVRHMRNTLLAETDWWVLPDRTPTQEQLDYRQALRDITKTATILEDVVWPTKPE